VTLRELIYRVAESFTGVEPGTNGPWRTAQTPVRNSAHWLILFSWVYSATNKEKYLDVVARLAEYLVSREARPHGFTFYNLREHQANQANGLIGQAWVFEALAEATRVLQNDRYAAVAEEVFLQHPFSERYGLWHSVEPDGRVLSVHSTLNQQVWFAATAARLPGPRSPEVKARVLKFMDRVEGHLHILGKGLLGMHVRSLPPTDGSGVKRMIRAVLRRWPDRVEDLRYLFASRASGSCSRPTLFRYLDMSLGYHAFSLYGLALLRAAVPHHPFWNSRSLRRVLLWTQSRQYKSELEGNTFAFGYNPTGFEVPYVLTVFGPYGEAGTGDPVGECRWWIQEQVRRCYDPAEGRFRRNTADPATLTSRLYEATRLPQWLLETELAI
jgi:hypothetical protein